MSTFNELIDFTRSTTGTYLDSVVYGDEVVVNNAFNDATGWYEPRNSSTISAVSNKLRSTADSAATFGGATTLAGLTVGKKYKIQGTASSNNSSAIVRIRVGIPQDLTSAYIEISQVTNSVTASTDFIATAETMYVGTIVTGHNGGDYVEFDAGLSVKEVIGGQVSGTPLLRTAAVDEPRLEYDAQGNALGLLIEEGRTNLFTESENMSTVQSGLTVTSNVIIAPDGTLTSDLCIPTAVSTEHSVTDQTTTIGQPAALSFFAKYGSGDYLLSLRGGGIGADFPSFNVQNGTVVNAGDSNWSDTKIESVGNGWYRCSSVGTPTSTSRLRVQFVSGTTRVFVGDGTGHYIWGIQEEAGAFPTSYIPTSGSTVTRTADIASLPVERFAYNQPQGTVVAFQETFGTAGNLVPWEIHTATTNRIVYNAKSSLATIITGGLVQASLNHADQLPSVFYKHGLAFKKDDIASSLDASILTDTSGTIPTVSSFKIGTDSALLAMLNGHIKQIQYYPKRLSNTELQLLTQPSASPTMNLTFDGQATSTLVEGLHD